MDGGRDAASPSCGRRKGSATCGRWRSTTDREPAVLVRAGELKDGEREITLKEYVWSPDGKALLFQVAGDLYHYRLADRALRRLTTPVDQERRPALLARLLHRRVRARRRPLDRRRRQRQGATADPRRRRGQDPQRQARLVVLGGDLVAALDRVLVVARQQEASPTCASKRKASPPIRCCATRRSTPPSSSSPIRRPGDRNPTVRVGVLDLATGATTWMKTGLEDGEDYVARVRFTPSGDRLGGHPAGARAGPGRPPALRSRDRRVQDDAHRAPRHLGRRRRRLRAALRRSRAVGLRSRRLVAALSVRRRRQARRARFTRRRRGGQARPRGRVDRRRSSSPAFAPQGSAPRIDSSTASDSTAASRDPRARGEAARHERRQGRRAKPCDRRRQHGGGGAPGASVDRHSSALDSPPRATLYRAGAEQAASRFRSSPPPPTTATALPQLGVPHHPRTRRRRRCPARMLKPPGFDPRRRYPVVMFHYGGPASQVVEDGSPERPARDLWHARQAQRGLRRDHRRQPSVGVLRQEGQPTGCTGASASSSSKRSSRWSTG